MKNVKLFVNDQECDIGNPEELGLALTYSIYDENNVQGRSSSYSKSIALKASDVNKLVFAFSEDTNASGIDQRQAPTARIEVDGTDIINGIIKMDSPKLDGKGNVVIYNLTILGDNGVWKNRMNDKNLRELDYSDQDHTYNKATIDTSETIAVGREYVYGLENRGRMTGDQFDGNKLTEVVIEDRYPSINVLSTLNRMFNDTGHILVSTLLNGAWFSKVFAPFVRDEFTRGNVFKTDRECRIFLDGDVGNTQEIQLTRGNSSRIRFGDITPTGYFNTPTGGGLFDLTASNWEYVVDEPVRMRWYLHYRVDIVLFAPLHVYDGVTKLHIMKNGVPIATEELDWNKQPDGSRKTTYKGLLMSEFENFAASDVIHCEFESDNIRDIFVGTIEEVDGTGADDITFFYNEVDPTIIRDGTVDVAFNLPDVEQLHWLSGIRDLCNLYFLTNPFTREVFVEDRDTFYVDTFIDWSDKIDISKPINVSFLGSQLHKTMVHEYRPDSNDEFVEQFDKDNDFTLAAHPGIAIDNQFASDGDGDIMNPVFAPTAMDLFPEIGISTVKIPKMWQDVTLPEKSTEFVPRVFYYNGVQSAGASEWKFEGSIRTDFPNMYSVDDVNDNDNSLYYDDTRRSNGLVEKFYRNWYRVQNTGRVIELSVDLTDKDISSLIYPIAVPVDVDFRIGINIDIAKHPEITGHWRILEVIDYDPLDRKPTRVKLISDRGNQKITPVTTEIEDGNTKVDTPYEDKKNPDPKTGTLVKNPKNNILVSEYDNKPAQDTEDAMMIGSNLSAKKNSQVLMGQNSEPDLFAKLVLAAGSRGNSSNALTIDEKGDVKGTNGFAGPMPSALNTADASAVPTTEVDGDVYLLDRSAALNVNNITWQASGRDVKITFSDSPDLSIYAANDFLEIDGATNDNNDGLFPIKSVDNGLKEMVIVNGQRVDNSEDETGSPGTGFGSLAEWDGSKGNDWTRFNSTAALWIPETPKLGDRCHNKALARDLQFDGTGWNEPSRLIPLPIGYRRNSFIKYVSATKIQVADALVPNKFRDFNDTMNVNLTTGLIIDIFTDIDTGAPPVVNSWYRVYIISDSSGVNVPFAVFSLAVSTIGPLIPATHDTYTWMGVIRTDLVAPGGTSILKFFVVGNANKRRYEWDEPKAVVQNLAAGNATVFTLVNLSAGGLTNAMPPEAQVGLLFYNFFANATGDSFIIRHISSAIAGTNIRQYHGIGGVELDWEADIILPNIAIDYAVTNAASGLNIFTRGFIIYL